jgi:hypothetical protein
MVIANLWDSGWESTTGRQNRLHLNNGKGVFTDVTATHMPVDKDVTVGLAIPIARRRRSLPTQDLDSTGTCPFYLRSSR